MLSNIESLAYLKPEIVLTATVVVLFFAHFFTAKREVPRVGLISNLALVGIVLSLAVHTSSFSLQPSSLFMGMITFDGSVS